MMEGRTKLIAKINDKLRKNLGMGKIEISLSDKVKQSPNRAEIIKAVREYRAFHPELDISGDHSVGLVVVDENAYVFRFEYLDERYDYAEEIGRRSLEISHVSEFKTVKLKKWLEEITMNKQFRCMDCQKITKRGVYIPRRKPWSHKAKICMTCANQIRKKKNEKKK